MRVHRSNRSLRFLIDRERPPRTAARRQTTKTLGCNQRAGVLGSLVFALTLLCCQAARAAEHEIPLFISASNAMQEGFARIVNHSDESGTVSIRAFDDSGRAFGPTTLSLNAWEAKHFNSEDLEMGSSSKGINGIGGGMGDWRLVLESDLDIEVLAYVRTTDGFLTSVHDKVRQPSSRHLVPIFNPGSNRNQVSKLRLINPGSGAAAVTIVGADDSGRRPPEIGLRLPAGEVRTFTAQQLEAGHGDLDGRLGDRSGKWRLFVSADRPIGVMSLLETPTGHLANLSTSTSVKNYAPPPGGDPDTGAGGFAPADQAAFDARFVGKRFATDRVTSYIDFLGGGRFDETFGSTPYNGTYVYRNTGPNTGTVTLTYSEDRCDYRLTFDATASGSGQYRCNTVSGSVDWRIEEIGGPVPPAPTAVRTGSTTIRFEWPWSVSAGTTYPFDLQLRQKGDVYWRNACRTVDFTSSGQATVHVDLSSLESATTYEFRYRHRDSRGSCDAAIRSHSRWSPIGEGRTQNDAGGGGGGGGGGTRHQVGDTITSMPTGSWVPDTTSNASFTSSGGTVTIRFSDDGYVVENGIRYTCDAGGGCRVENRVVELGVIVETAESSGGAAPAMRGASTQSANIDLRKLGTSGEKSIH